MYMKLIHTSPNEIKEISKCGMFDDCLFFSCSEYVTTQAKEVYIYSIEINSDKMINVSDLHDDEIIENIADALDVDSDVAERMLDGRDNAFDHGKDGEDDWWLQAKQGECAKKMGYEAAKSQDEQGAVYIIPMLSRENDLILERVDVA